MTREVLVAPVFSPVCNDVLSGSVMMDPARYGGELVLHLGGRPAPLRHICKCGALINVQDRDRHLGGKPALDHVQNVEF